MYIATNNFKVVAGKESEFEEIWRNRDSHLKAVPGIIRFALLRGDRRRVHQPQHVGEQGRVHRLDAERGIHRRAPRRWLDDGRSSPGRR